MKNNLLDKKSRFKKEKKKKAFIKFKWKNSYASRNLEKRKKKFQYNIRICICDPMAKQTKKALTWIISMWLSEAYIKNASKDFWLELRDERDIYFLMYKYITGPKAYIAGAYENYLFRKCYEENHFWQFAAKIISFLRCPRKKSFQRMCPGKKSL